MMVMFGAPWWSYFLTGGWLDQINQKIQEFEKVTFALKKSGFKHIFSSLLCKGWKLAKKSDLKWTKTLVNLHYKDIDSL